MGDGASCRGLLGQPGAASVDGEQGSEHGRGGRSAAEAPREVGGGREAGSRHGDRGPNDSPQACVRGASRDAQDLRGARTFSWRCGQARAALSGGLRGRSRSRPAAAALSPRRPLRAQPDRRAAAASDRGGLAHGRRLRVHRRLTRSRCQLAAFIACAERVRCRAAAAAHGRRGGAGGTQRASRRRPHEYERLASLDGAARRRGRIRRVPRRRARPQHRDPGDQSHRPCVRPGLRFGGRRLQRRRSLGTDLDDCGHGCLCWRRRRSAAAAAAALLETRFPRPLRRG